MLIAAIIIYVVFAVFTGAQWPLELLNGKAGPIGYVLVLLWLALLIAGLVT